MEVEERWGDDDDVIDMDVDMSEEEQMALISEIHTTRNDLPLATSVGSVTQKAPFSLTNTVRAYRITRMFCEKQTYANFARVDQFATIKTQNLNYY